MSPQVRSTESGSSPPSPPPPLPPEFLEIQAGYHRLILAMSLAVLCMCFLLPAPGSHGEVRLPLIDAPLPSLCMLKREYGIDCPGCGLTRCFLSMAHLQVGSAWGHHPVGVLLFAMLVVQIPYRLYQIWRLRQGRPQLIHWALRLLIWLMIAAILAQWILRMAGLSA